PAPTPFGITSLISESVTDVNSASISLINTWVSSSSGLNNAPVITISIPPGPLIGLTVSITGNGTTVKSGACTTSSPIAIVTGPLLTSSGATTTSWLALASVTTAVSPSNVTTLPAIVSSNPSPVRVTWVPAP